MKRVDRVMLIFWILVLVLLFGWAIRPAPAACDMNFCYGGMCMDSAACAPGCHCIGGRCG